MVLRYKDTLLNFFFCKALDEKQNKVLKKRFFYRKLLRKNAASKETTGERRDSRENLITSTEIV